MPISRILRVWVWFRNASATLGFLWLLATVTPVARWGARWLAGPWEDPTGDVLIVLGGSLLDKDLIGMNSYWRAIYASLTWREGGFRHVVISGGGREETPIAVPMRQFLLCTGVPPQVISIETTSNDTRENAANTRRLLEDLHILDSKPRMVLLTSDYHMFRASRVFRKAGLNIRPRPFPDVLKRAECISCRWDAFLELAGEVSKIGYYYVRGWL